MKINILAVGKIKEKFLKDGINEYLKRLSKFCDINIIELNETPPSKNEKEQIEFEGDEILPKLKSCIVVLDILGKEITSPELASFIKTETVNGENEFTFVIGGSYGLSKRVKDKANFKISFSKMTFPHQLFRLMLLEQIYRALTILNNMPYHK